MTKAEPLPSRTARLGALVKRLLQVALVGALLIFIGQSLLSQWAEVEAEIRTADGGALLLAYLGTLVGLGLLPAGPWLALRALGHGRSLRAVWRMFFVSNVGKYLPGGIWALPGRAFFYQRDGIPLLPSVATVGWEFVLLIISAALMGLLALRVILVYVPLPLVVLGLALMLLGLIGLGWGLSRGRLRRFLGRWPLPERIRQALARDDLWLLPGQVERILAVYGLAWLAIGLGFVALVSAFSGPLAPESWPELMGVYLGSWVMGFVVVVAPSGIGVRDVLVVLGLRLFVPEPLPSLIAIVARLIWLVAELNLLALVLLLTETRSAQHEL